MNKFMFETTDATKARRIMDILAEGVSHAAIAPSAATTPVAPRPQAVAATTPAAPPAPPAAPPAPPAAPPAPPAAPPAPAGSVTKEELIRRMGSYVSQGLPVATIRQINTQLCGQPNSQAIPEEQLASAMAMYDAAFAAHKGS